MLSSPNLVKMSPPRNIFGKLKILTKKNFWAHFWPFLAHFLKIDPFFKKCTKNGKRIFYLENGPNWLKISKNHFWDMFHKSMILNFDFRSKFWFFEQKFVQILIFLPFLAIFWPFLALFSPIKWPNYHKTKTPLTKTW